MEGSFSERCYSALERVPKGKITTYKELACFVGGCVYRAVGSVVRKNPNLSSKYPCYRVIDSNGWVGEYVYGESAKEKLLEKEGIVIQNGKVVNFREVFFRFDYP